MKKLFLVAILAISGLFFSGCSQHYDLISTEKVGDDIVVQWKSKDPLSDERITKIYEEEMRNICDEFYKEN